MEVIEIKEQEDGSALVTLDLSRTEEEMLIEYAVVDILKKQIDEKRIDKKAKNIPIYEEVINVIDATKRDFNVSLKPYKYYNCELCDKKQEILEYVGIEDFIKIQTCVVCSKVLCNECKRYDITDKKFEYPKCLNDII